jgi:hypothetical protein
MRRKTKARGISMLKNIFPLLLSATEVLSGKMAKRMP